MDGDRLKIMLISILILAAALGLLFLKRCFSLLRSSLRLAILVGFVAGLIALAWWFQRPDPAAPPRSTFYQVQQEQPLQR
jgi:hypothetical protein